MRKVLVAASIAVVCAFSVPAGAGANVVVAGPGAGTNGAATYATPRVVISKSAPAHFVNLDPITSPHDVVSKKKKADGKTPLFKSAIINGGSTAEIQGIASVAPGDYEFYCTIHPQMLGIATIVS